MLSQEVVLRACGGLFISLILGLFASPGAFANLDLESEKASARNCIAGLSLELESYNELPQSSFIKQSREFTEKIFNICKEYVDYLERKNLGDPTLRTTAQSGENPPPLPPSADAIHRPLVRSEKPLSELLFALRVWDKALLRKAITKRTPILEHPIETHVKVVLAIQELFLQSRPRVSASSSIRITDRKHRKLHHPIEVLLTPSGDIIVDLYHYTVGEGSFKKVIEVAHLQDPLHPEFVSRALEIPSLRRRQLQHRGEFETEVLELLHSDNASEYFPRVYWLNSLKCMTELFDTDLFGVLVEKQFPANDRHRRAITLNIAKGLKYLHKKFIGHFDIKLENILCTFLPDLRCVLTDFGFAVDFSRKTETEIQNETKKIYSRGTHGWFAPEALEKHLSPVLSHNETREEKIKRLLGVDTFAFGLLALRVLNTAQFSGLPYSLENDYFLYSDVILSFLESLQERPELYSSVNHLVVRTLSPDPVLRPNMSETVRALEYLSEKMEKDREFGDQFASPSQVDAVLKNFSFYHPESRTGAGPETKLDAASVLHGAFWISGCPSFISEYAGLDGICVHYQDGNQFRVIQLDVPVNKECLLQELRFLTALGTLRVPLVAFAKRAPTQNTTSMQTDQKSY